MIRKRFVKKQPTIYVQANHNIRVPEVRVLAERGEMIGVMSTREALDRAQTEGKDLVLVTDKSKPPIAKIIDLAKYKYQLQQKEAESRKNARKQEIKEVRLSPFMGEGDFQTKLNRVIEFLEDGDKVRLVTTEFKGRLTTKKEFGQEVLQRIIEASSNVGSVEIPPQPMGRKMMAQMMPTKKK